MKLKSLGLILATFLATHTIAQKLQFTSNKPFGEAKGIYPGRVTWTRDSLVACWNGKEGCWWDNGNIDQNRLEAMYDKSLCALSGASSVKKAWQNIFKYYNEQNGRGRRGYKRGETIVIKINLNNTYDTDDHDNDIDQSPQATIALLRQLTAKAGIPQECITIYDATIGWKKRAMPDRIYKPAHRLFPRVKWMSATGSQGVDSAHWVKDAITYTDPSVMLGTVLPQAVTDASYLINIALLKGHEISGVTLCAKNHFGSIPFPARMHGTHTVSQMTGTEGDYSAYVDLMGCPNLGKKTLLYIVDGIYGMQTNVGAPRADRDRWKMFGNQWSASYFMSLDPVAIECVCMDFLFAEFGGELGFSGAPQFKKGSSRNCDNYLKEAAKGWNAKFGDYRPNGIKTGSLGVFEHWNNSCDKQYSRNLGKDDGIELYKVK
ncbi:MAG: DUF362 domain-containing protein [Paraprevotella sp.]|nr:DUF362 domain-containing protein [Paraprevotella sp.]